MQYFENEIKINCLFSYELWIVRNWSVIAKDPYAKSEWLIARYGKENALFHAIRLIKLGFIIDEAVCKILIARKDITSEYIIRIILTYFNKYDHIELKIEHNFDAGNQLGQIRQLYAPINNDETLKLITNLPQQIETDSFINTLFNGSSFF